MSAKVNLDFGSNQTVNTSLFYGINNMGETYLRISDENGDDLITENLLYLTEIKFDDNNPLRTTITCDEMSHTIIFQQTTDIADFISFIQKNATIEQVVGQRVFQITPNPASQNALSQYVPAAVGFIGKQLYNSVKTFVGVAADSIDAEKPNTLREADGFALGYITRSISNIELINYDENKPGSFSIVTITSAQMLKTWKQKLNIEDDEKSLDKYHLLQIQWKTISRGQWNHSFALRQYVVEVENAIKSSEFATAPDDLLIFDVFMSYAVISNDSSSDSDKFHLVDGTIVSFDQMCAQTFWLFKSFSEKYLIHSSPKYSIPEYKRLFMDVRTILSSISQSTNEMLDQYNISSLDFCALDISYLFTRDRSNEDALLYITSLINTENVHQFIQCTICSILVLLQGMLQQLPSEQAPLFKKRFQALLPNVEMRLILYNTEKLLTTIRNETAQ